MFAPVAVFRDQLCAFFSGQTGVAAVPRALRGNILILIADTLIFVEPNRFRTAGVFKKGTTNIEPGDHWTILDHFKQFCLIRKVFIFIVGQKGCRNLENILLYIYEVK